MTDVKRVGVVGAGQMGSGIAEVHARAGLDVVVAEVNQSALDAGKYGIEKSLQRGVRKEKLSQGEADAALNNLTFTTEIADLADRDLVVEAIVEAEEAKLELLRTLDGIVQRSEERRVGQGGSAG